MSPARGPAPIARLVAGVQEVVGDTSYADVTARRDAVLAAVIAATHPRG